jgi:predicted Fe-Mo cluster-binding NifX family protein
MKIAVTSQDRTHVTEHAGHCQRFWIYEITEQAIAHKACVDVPKDQTFHALVGSLPAHLQDVQVLISGGMGQSLIERLGRHDVKGLVTPETQPDVAVAAYLAGTLVTKQPEHQTCTHGAGPGHHHG